MLATSTVPGEKRYPLTGEVLAVDLARKVLTVRHNAVEGVMPAMAMEFSVSGGDAAAAKAGEHIRAQMVLIPRRRTRAWRRSGPTIGRPSDAQSRRERALREDTHDRGDGAYREVGEAMPDFALFDQSGRVVQSARFRGKQVMLNFFYTRCPVATMCPAATAKMMVAQHLAKEAGVKDVEFVSISFDSADDTPGVLKDYADARGIDTSNFSFLTGPEAIRDLLTQFGVIAEFKGSWYKHTLATLLIDAQGKIIWRADGSVWDPKDFVARMRRA